MMINSLGLLEVSGLVAGIDAADAMVKAADVRILSYKLVSPGLVTLVVEGDLAACRAALDAGACAAKRLGHVISQKEIGRPDGDTEWLVTEGFITHNTASPSSPSTSTAPCSSTPANTYSPSSAISDTTHQQVVASSDPTPLLLVNLPSTQINAEEMSNQQQSDAVNEEIMTLTAKALLDELQSDSHGMTVSEVAAHFSCSNEIAKKRLDALWRAGMLRKRNSRYRCKLINEKVGGEIESVSDQITSDNQEKK